MPAIRPERLEREAESLLDLVGEPAALRWRVVELLEFYADRTKRHGVHEHMADATVCYRVPAPVMHALKRSLHRGTVKNQERAQLIANELWSVDVQEARLLGIHVLANASTEDLIATVRQWAKTTRDPSVKRALAQVAYQGLISRGEEHFKVQVEKWALSRTEELQRLGISTLQAAASEEHIDRIHLVFETLNAIGFRKRMLSRLEYAALIEFLSAKNPSETTGYLLHGLKRNRGGLREVVRRLIPGFPLSQRKRLESEI
jgi:hypothetical protein